MGHVITLATAYPDTSYNHKIFNQFDLEKKDLSGRLNLGPSDQLKCGRE